MAGLELITASFNQTDFGKFKVITDSEGFIITDWTNIASFDNQANMVKFRGLNRNCGFRISAVLGLRRWEGEGVRKASI